MADRDNVRTTDEPLHRLGYAESTVAMRAVRIDAQGATPVSEMLAEEIPVTFAYNGAAHAVMMATPQDLEDFAVGFSFTEGLAAPADLQRISVVRYGRAIELQLEVPVPVASRAGAHSRRLSGRTGCGICGVDDVERVLRELPRVASDRRISAASVARAMRELADRQPLNAATGAMHAAGWARADGSLVHVREDIGRHNALDKLAGALLRSDTAVGEGFIVVTSRGSFELVQKAALLGAPLLVAVSAPSALAVRIADQSGLALAGFARDGRMTAYAHPERIATGEDAR